MKKLIEEAKKAVAQSQHITFLTGAGMSAESGVPTFRGTDGLWKNYRAEQLATPQAFDKDPETVWQWYDWRRGLIGRCKPNPGHRAIAKLESYKKVTIITQNVDGLHEKAGSKNIYELHGNIWTVRCMSCGKEEKNFDIPIEILPKCSQCSGILRPGVVWFGEMLNPSILDSSVDALANSQLTVVVGTSGMVQPAASLAMHAKNHGSQVIEINIQETPNYDLIDYFIVGKAGEILPELLKE